MRFEPRKKRYANPIGRRESRVLFVLVMLFGFVVLMIGQAMKPETWAWLFDRGVPQRAKHEQPDERDVVTDTRLAITAPKSRLEDQITLPFVTADVATSGDSMEYFAGVKPELLAEVEENREFNSDELAPRMNLIEILRRSEYKELKKASIGEVGFLQLYEQPHVYRGKLVTVAGTAKLAQYETSTVADGVDRYFVIWLRPAGDQPRPIVIYCLEKPPDFPEGTKLNERVRITGFFFKKRAYAAQDTFRTAPAIFAKTFDWKPVVETPPWSPTGQEIAWILGVTAVAALLVVALTQYRTRQKFLSRRKLGDATITLVEEQVLPSVGEQLSGLGDQKN